jgi:two-component system KDP operon response regulator KdpE
MAVDPTKRTILCVDDEPQILKALTAILDARGFRVVTAVDGASALDATLDGTPDLIVLDLTLPDTDGLELLPRLRSFLAVPVLVLSARDDEADKIEALNRGADDYLTKPFSAGEFVARVNALLRRAGGASDAGAPAVVEVGDLVIDLAHRSVTRSGEPVVLTPTEYAILAYLAVNPDRVVTWDQLIHQVWGADFAGDTASLRVHVSHLRRKVEPHPSVPRYILTEPRVGFRFSTRYSQNLCGRGPLLYPRSTARWSRILVVSSRGAPLAPTRRDPTCHCSGIWLHWSPSRSQPSWSGRSCSASTGCRRRHGALGAHRQRRRRHHRRRPARLPRVRADPA